MDIGSSLRLDSLMRRRWLGPTLLAVLSLLSYRALWLGGRRFDIDGALFRPGELPIVVVLLVAGWLLWMRKVSLRSVTAAPAPRLALSLAALGSGPRSTSKWIPAAWVRWAHRSSSELVSTE